MNDGIHYDDSSVSRDEIDWQHDSTRERARARLARARAWFDHRVAYAIRAGLLGAASIVLFFFLIDLAQGRAMWTPAALGSAVFTGENLLPGEPFSWALVFGYTALHAFLFVAVGLMASMAVPLFVRLRRELSKPLAGLLFAAALFSAMHLFFQVFDATMLESQGGRLGSGRVVVANMLASIVIAFDLLRSATRFETPPASDAHLEDASS